MKIRSLLFPCAVLLAGVSCPPAFADTFNLNLTSTLDNASAVISANPTGTAGQYLINAISGTMDGQTISGLLPVGSYPVLLAPNDNLFFFPPPSGGALLDISGMSFQLADGTDVNLYFGVFLDGDPNTYNVILGPGEVNDELGVNAVTASRVTTVTPEPSSLLLLGTGLAGLVGAMRRRFVA